MQVEGESSTDSEERKTRGWRGDVWSEASILHGHLQLCDIASLHVVVLDIYVHCQYLCPCGSPANPAIVSCSSLRSSLSLSRCRQSPRALALATTCNAFSDGRKSSTRAFRREKAEGGRRASSCSTPRPCLRPASIRGREGGGRPWSWAEALRWGLWPRSRPRPSWRRWPWPEWEGVEGEGLSYYYANGSRMAWLPNGSSMLP